MLVPGFLLHNVPGARCLRSEYEVWGPGVEHNALAVLSFLFFCFHLALFLFPHLDFLAWSNWKSRQGFFRAFFTWVSKVICVFFGFALLRLVIDLKNLALLSQPIRNKTPTIMTRSRTFSRASWRRHVFASRFDWLAGLSVSFAFGQIDYFGFGFRHSKSLYWN